MMNAIYYPEAAAHLTFLSHELRDDYRDFIWLLRDRDQSSANKVRAEVFRKFALIMGGTSPQPVKKLRPSAVIIQFARRVAACFP